MQVKKYSGELITFDVEKLRISLSKSGAKEEQVEEVVNQIKNQLFEGITTKELYDLAFNKLREIGNSVAARYSLKKALRDLGPEGYYFEKWVSKFFKNLGYQVMHSQTIEGLAVKHEADVIAQKDDDMYWLECKFRNTVDAKISVTTPMYLLSRINDISVKEYDLFGAKRKFTKGWLVTNAYLTSDSIAFGEYYNLKLLSWDYPANKSIKNLVDQRTLYPITCLTTLNSVQKALLMERNYMLVKEIKEDYKILDILKLNEANLKKVAQEVRELC